MENDGTIGEEGAKMRTNLEKTLWVFVMSWNVTESGEFRILSASDGESTFIGVTVALGALGLGSKLEWGVTGWNPSSLSPPSLPSFSYYLSSFSFSSSLYNYLLSAFTFDKDSP